MLNTCFDFSQEIIERRKKVTAKLNKPQVKTAFDPNTNQIVDIDSINASATSSAKKSPSRKKKSIRKSRWSSGILKPKPKPKPKEDAETATSDKEKEKDTSAVGNEMEQDNAEDSDFDGEVTLNETKEIKV